jgi:deazaflavin-dependent oxidoreductase (nitroreductase family)
MWKQLRRLMLAGGITAGVMAVLEWRRGRRAGEVPFDRVRKAMNDHVNPLLMEHGLMGGRHSEIACIEHVGRKTGQTHVTPVHPTFVEDRVWIPLPYGKASQWAKNVIAAGHCRLQLHGTMYELDEPQIVPASDDPKLPQMAARLAGWLGIEYLRLHRFAEHQGMLVMEGEAAPVVEPASQQFEVGTPVPA